MTVQTKEQRLLTIKAAAEKIQKKANFRRKVTTSASKIRRAYAEESEVRRTKVRKFDRSIERLDENHNQWTDSTQYAENHYGDVYRDTTRFDND